MASRLEEDLTCSICYNLIKHPVVLSCSHSFCKVCLENWWKDKPIKTCPVCKKTSSHNSSLNLVQTFAEQIDQNTAESLCSLHSEKLRLFCLDHQQPVCVVCRDSRTHKDHRFSPIEEATSDLREQLQTSIKPLQDKLKVLTERKELFKDSAAHITAQTQQTEKQIRDQFEKLHQFLLEEEQSRMKALREEEQQKTQNMKDKIVAVSREIETVSKTIAEAEEQLRASDSSFLLQYKTIVERVQRCQKVPELQIRNGALINQAKHLGNLGFNIWKNMKRLVQFYPVILNPNSASSKLILSEDLSSVKFGETQELPENPERPKDQVVFGSEWFTSGTHSWDVEVREKDDLTCSICYDLYKDPVVLSCSHSFCKVCLENWWKDKPIKTCPVCKKTSSNDPPLNLVLKNLVQTFTEQRDQAAAEHLCSLHSEKLRLFCLDHQQPVCVTERLLLSDSLLTLSVQVLNERKELFKDSAAHITAQTQQTEKQIRDQFEKLHQFLLDEEQSRMKALREEEQQKTQNMKDNIVAVSREIETVSKTIAEAEEQLRASDSSFLLQYKTIVERVQHCPLVKKMKMKRGALIDQAKHLGNLSFDTWMNMKRLVQFYPVILDPNRSAPELILSEDLSSVKFGEKQKLPQNPERLQNQDVFGFEVFTSGTHSWDVELGDNKDWVVGVSGSVQRGQKTETGVWGICFQDGKYTAFSHPDTFKPLSVKSLQRVRVKLDFDRGTVTFRDPDTNTDLRTFRENFTKWLFPILCTKDKIPLKILPKDITVKV
ncbi:hypothetical protein WMY93_001736 [Mugilogobius chulae]|uniref:Uncharacterized protein n=1 Tax=Mugilogobius chulae TaxID=88201 RepID=A0AAW0PS71_9GOBI